ncbi:MAG: class I SAM-dependent methyltransferase [Zoogloeaceae bacterium]|nr:class I SAM-dependent methyltransferase [Zoogloeaceae bacterium]
MRFSSETIELSHPPELWRCSSCRSGFTQNSLSSSDSQRLYALGDSGSRWSAADAFEYQKCPEVITELERLLKAGVRIADVGCGAGGLLDMAAFRGAITTGIELSTSCQTALRQRGHRVADRLGQLNEGELDVICAFDLVEHLYDLQSFLHLCWSRLAENGYLVILTGDIESQSARLAGPRWWYAAYPEHILFPSPAWLLGLTGWQTARVVRTYASRGYRQESWRAKFSIFRQWMRSCYRGLPALGPDHCLYILQKHGLSDL